MPTRLLPGFSLRRWSLPLLFVALVYAATLGVRLGELPGWNNDQFKVDGEYIMATHDAYAWLAGAYGVGTGAGTPLARMARAYAEVTGRSVEEFAFYFPAIAGSLVAVAVMLWAWTLGGLEAGLGAGFMAALAPGFYFRSRLGYYDTDIATLLFPLVQSWVLAHWLAPHLRKPLDMVRRVREAPPSEAASLLWPLATGLLVRLGGADWHTHLPDYNLLVAWAALGLVLLGRRDTRPRLLWGLAIHVLAGFFGNFGLAVAVGLALLFRFAPRLAAPAQARVWPGLAVLVLVLAVNGSNRNIVAQTMKKFAVYSKTTAEVAGEQAAASRANRSGVAAAASAPPVYPGITQSVVEAQNVPLKDVLAQIMPRGWATVAGLAGFLLVAALRPAAVFLLPLAALSVLAVVLGARMTMFGGAAASLGLCLPLAWAARRLLGKGPGGTVAAALAPALLAGAVYFPFIQEYARYGPMPIITQQHATALKALSGIAPPGSRVWTWWDWGYASMYYARRLSFADGARHSGEYLFPLAASLTTPIPLQANQIIAYSAQLGYEPWREWSKHPGDEVAQFVRILGSRRVAPAPQDRQYLVVCWENLNLASWITYYGSWDAGAGQGVHGVSQQIAGAFSFDPMQGTLENQGRSLRLRSVDILSPRGRNHQYLGALQAPCLVVNEVNGQALLMDDLAYNSMMVQLLMSPPGNPAIEDTFRLVYEGFPMVRIYEVL